MIYQADQDWIFFLYKDWDTEKKSFHFWQPLTKTVNRNNGMVWKIAETSQQVTYQDLSANPFGFMCIKVWKYKKYLYKQLELDLYKHNLVSTGDEHTTQSHYFMALYKTLTETHSFQTVSKQMQESIHFFLCPKIGSQIHVQKLQAEHHKQNSSFLFNSTWNVENKQYM